MSQNRLQKLREKAGLTQGEVAKRIGVARPTYANYESGKREPDFDNIKKLADLFDVTVDFLVGQTDDPHHSNGRSDEEIVNSIGSLTVVRTPDWSPALTAKEEGDIAKDLERMLTDLESNEAFAFSGEPEDDEERELLRASLENSLRIAKMLAKKKFTPKKYRK